MKLAPIMHLAGAVLAAVAAAKPEAGAAATPATTPSTGPAPAPTKPFAQPSMRSAMARALFKAWNEKTGACGTAANQAAHAGAAPDAPTMEEVMAAIESNQKIMDKLAQIGGTPQ